MEIRPFLYPIPQKIGSCAVIPFAGRDCGNGVRQRAMLAKERRMDRRHSVRIQAAELPRLALRGGGLKVVQQLLVVQVPLFFT